VHWVNHKTASVLSSLLHRATLEGKVRCWRGYLSGARCKFEYGPAGTTATRGFIKIQIILTFLVPAYPGWHGKKAVKWASVCLSTEPHNTDADSIIIITTTSFTLQQLVTSGASITINHC